MTKVNKKLLRNISIFSAVIAIILGLLAFPRFQSQDAAPSKLVALPGDPFLNQASQLLEPAQVALVVPSVESPQMTSKKYLPVRPLSTPTPANNWMEINNKSILDLPTLMTFEPGCDDKLITLPEFRVLPWTPDVFENGEFDFERHTAIAWEHLNFTGLWIHSGFDWSGNPLAAQPLQYYLERKEDWRKRTPDEFDQKVADCLIGSKVSVQLGAELLEGKVTAVLRIPASGVETASNHVMDLVPYLAKTYPESGFDKLKAPQLLLYFCGRLLATEKADYSIEDYSRTRIIVAIDFDS